jgi:hypothetical protein
MPDKTVKTTLVIGTDTGALQGLESKLQTLSQTASGIQVGGGAGTMPGPARMPTAADRAVLDQWNVQHNEQLLDKLDKVRRDGVKPGDGARGRGGTADAEPVINERARGMSASEMAALEAAHPSLASPTAAGPDDWGDYTAARAEAATARRAARERARATAATSWSGRMERWLGIDPTVVTGDAEGNLSKAEKQQLNDILAKRQRLARMFGGPAAQMGAAGIALYGGRTMLSGLETWQQQSIGLEGGLYSGNLYSALSAQAGYNRSIASAFTRMGLGATQIGGMGLAASALTGGKFAAALGMGGPLGMAVGGGLAVGAMAADPFIEGYLGRKQARTQAAIQMMSEGFERRSALAQGQLSLMPFARDASQRELISDDLSEGRLRRGAGAFLMSTGELAYRLRAFRQSGGMDQNAYEAVGMERRYGIGVEAQGRYFRSFQPGEGATGNASETLRSIVETFRGSGSPMQRMTEYLQRIAASNEAMADRGLIINEESADRLRRSLVEGAGLSPFQAETARSGMAGAARGVMQTAIERRMPRSAVDAILFQQGLRRFGGLDETIAGFEHLQANPDEAAEFIRGAMPAGFTGGQEAAFMSQVSGLFPGAAAKLRNARPQAARSVAPLSFSDVREWVGRALGAAQTRLLETRTESDVSRTFTANLGDLSSSMTEYSALIKKATENLRGSRLESLFDDLRDALDVAVGGHLHPAARVADDRAP